MSTMDFSGMAKDNTLWAAPHFSGLSMTVTQQVKPIREGLTSFVDIGRSLSKWSGSFLFRAMTTEDKRYLFDFWKRHNGAGAGFWMPSWLSDFVPSRDLTIGDQSVWVNPTKFGTLLNTIVGASDPFIAPDSPDPMTFGLMIVYRDRTIQFRGISGYASEPIAGEDRIDMYQDSSVFGALSSGAVLPDIALLSLVRFVRMEAGNLDMKWITDNSKVDMPLAMVQKMYAGSLVDTYEL